MTKSRKFWSKLEGTNLDNRYFLNKLLGTGGFGAVYFTDEVVRDRVIRQLAVKLIELDEDNSETQLEELIAATNLKHPHLLDCFAPGECELSNEDFLYLLMELAQTSLETQIETGKLSENEVRQLISEVASALVYLHDKKITHRDLKPGNILKVGDKWKISDFGLVRKLQKGSVTMTSTLLGSAGYAPPEAYDGQISTSWDIWSLGIIIAEALTGELPFKGDTPLQLQNQIIKEKPDLSQLPPTMKELVEACLQKDRKNRPTAQQVLDWFSPTLQTPPSNAGVSSPPLNKGGLGGVQPAPNLVSSETGVDYTPLNNLLAAQEWKQADQLTYDLMKKATNREGEGSINEDSYKNFPREDLKIIDNLWVFYSNGKFGFSVQKKIWIEVGGTPGEWDEDVFDRFCDRIGWRKGGNYLYYDKLTFNINAPEAHLPALCSGAYLPVWAVGLGLMTGVDIGGVERSAGKVWRRGRSFLFSRL